MNQTLIDLKGQRADLDSQMEALVARMGDREPKNQEVVQFNDLENEITGLNSRIEQLEKIESRKTEMAKLKDKASRKKDTFENLQKSFSLRRAINMAGDKKPLDGAEREVYEIAVEEGKQTKKYVEGNVAIPASMFRVATQDEMQKRTTLTVGTAATAGNLVETDLYGVAEPLVARPVIASLGAQFWNNLQGNVEMVRTDTVPTMVWKGETAANTEVNPTFDKIDMAPIIVGGFTPISKTLLRQDSFGIERLVRQFLEEGIARALDVAAFNGSGSGQPTGILQHADFVPVAGDTNGKAPAWGDLVGAETTIDAANAPMDSLAYVFTPEIIGKLKTTERAASTNGQFIISDVTGMTVNGYRYVRSNLLPKNLTKGTGTNLHAWIFGNWSKLIIGQWGGIDLVVDQYTQATSTVVRIIANAWLNTMVERGEAFSGQVDAIAV